LSLPARVDRIRVGPVTVLTLNQQQWTDRIRRKMSATVEQIIEVGVDLEAAKVQLGHGRFGKMLADLEIDPQMAQRFMRIAGHETLANTSTWTHLPTSYRTLAELSRIPAPLLERAISNGEVTRETRTREAEELYTRLCGKTTRTTTTTTETTHTPPIDTTATEHELSPTGDTPPLADENGEPLTTSGSEGRKAEGGADDEPTSGTDEGAGSTTHDPAPSVDPLAKLAAEVDASDVGYRAAVSSALKKALEMVSLDTERAIAVQLPNEREFFLSSVRSIAEWCESVQAVADRPHLKAVQ
jgi:hypothetical protein